MAQKPTQKRADLRIAVAAIVAVIIIVVIAWFRFSSLP